MLRTGVSLLLLTVAGAARAAPCDESNLLAGRQPVAWTAAFRPDLVTDGKAALPGGSAEGSQAAVLGPSGAALVWDLGTEVELGAAFLQASADDLYAVELSPDGRSWTVWWQAQAVGPPRAGLRARVSPAQSGRGRFLRLSAGGGDRRYGVSELQVFCRRPAALEIELRPSALAPTHDELARGQALAKSLLVLLAMAALLLLYPGRATRVLLTGAALAALALALAAAWSFGRAAGLAVAALAAAGLALGWLRTRRRQESRQRLALAGGLALLLALAPLAYTNFSDFGGYWSVHYHDAAHYFLGAKYAPELRYTRLYRCLAEADREEARWPASPQRPLRDLHTNRLSTQAAVLAAGEACPARFGVERWAEFRADAVFFQSQLHPAAWATLLTDHGYNATPVWTWLFRLVLGSRPASTGWLQALAHLDEVVYLGLVPLLVWGFGLRAGVLAALTIGLGFPWIWLWTGGGIGRSLWLAAALAGAAWVRRGRLATGGALLGGAAALQVFPVLLLGGAVLGLVVDRLRRRPPVAGQVRLLGAATAGLVGSILLSFTVAGPSLWLDFLHNSLKHVASSSSNRIGLPQLAAVVGWPAPLSWLLFAGFLALFVAALARLRSTADRMSLSALLPLCALNLSSYYLTVLVCALPLLATPARAALALAVLVLMPQLGVLLVGGVPGPAYYAAVAGLYLAAATAWLVGLTLRARAPAGPGAGAPGPARDSPRP